MTLQHLRSSTANKRPLPAGMSDGQLAVNTNTASPGLFFKDSTGNLVKAGPVHVGTTAPNASPASGGATGNSTGELWLDTSVTPNQLKAWNGSSWVSDFPDEIPVAKLADGAARQLLQTDAAGTGVEWTSNVDVPGTLDVTSTATFDSIASHPLGSAGAPTITFTGDTNTGIYSPGADQLALSTAGSGRLFVDASGNVSVGSSSAFATSAGRGNITLNGSTDSLLAFGNAGSISAYLLSNSSELTILASGARNQTFYTNNTERLRITSAGLVGVGVSSPSELLHLGSGGKIRLNRADNATGSTINDGGSGNGIVFNSLNNDGFTFQNAGTTVFKIDTAPNGNRVGIGTTSPSSALSIDGDSALGNIGSGAPIVTLKNTNTGNFNTAQIVNRDSGGNIAGGILFRNDSHGASGSTSLLFITRTGGTSRSALAIGANGTVEFDSAASTAPAVFKINSSEVARLDSSGRLLVGTSSGSAKTVINGDLKVGGTVFSTKYSQSSPIVFTITAPTGAGNVPRMFTLRAVQCDFNGANIGSGEWVYRFAGAASSNVAVLRSNTDGTVPTITVVNVNSTTFTVSVAFTRQQCNADISAIDCSTIV